MKVYKIAMTEGYKWGFHSDENSVSLLDMDSLFKNEEIDIENLLPVKFEINDKANRGKKQQIFYLQILGTFGW